MLRAACWTIVAALALPALVWAQAGDEKKVEGEKKAEGKSIKIEGEIKVDDPKFTVHTQDGELPRPGKVHEYKMTKGQTVVIRLNSREEKYADPYLIVQDSTKKELAFNDDDEANQTLNSKLVFTAPKDDTYLVIATSYDDSVGKYELTIEPPAEKGGKPLAAKAKEPISEKAEELAKLKAELKAVSDEVGAKFAKATTSEEKDQFRNLYFEALAENMIKMNAFAEANATEPQAKAAALEVSGMINMLTQAGPVTIAPHLRKLAETAKANDIRGLASLALAEILIKQADMAFRKKETNQATKLNGEAIALLELVVDKFGDVKSPQGTLASMAKDTLFILTTLGVGKTAPDMEGEEIEGKKFKLSDYRGKVTVVYFWGSWCGPCVAMIPHEREMAKKHEKAPFAFVGINTDREKDKAKEFLKNKEITWTQVWDAGSTQGPLAKGWKVSAFPTLYVLDANGVIRLRAVGDPGKIFEETIDELLAEMKK